MTGRVSHSGAWYQITHFKIPRHVRFVTDYPMTVTGKAQKFVMRAAMAQELAAAQ